MADSAYVPAKLALRLSALLLLVFSVPAAAMVALSIAVDGIAGEGWETGGIQFEVGSSHDVTMAVVIRVATLRLDQWSDEFRKLALSCTEIDRVDNAWRCNDGLLIAESSPSGAQRATWNGTWHDDGRLHLEVSGLRLAGGRVGTRLSMTANAWDADVRLYRLTVRELAALDTSGALPSNAQLKGNVSGRIDLRGTTADIERVTLDLGVEGLSFATPDGRHAAENIVVKLDASARRRGGRWAFDSALRWPQGALYLEPLFIDAAAAPVKVDATGSWSARNERIDLDSWSVSLDRALTVSGSVAVATPDWKVIDLTVAGHSDDAGRLYDVLAQPYLIGTPGDDLAVSGKVGFVFHFDTLGAAQAGLELRELSLRDRRDRFELSGVAGTLAWARMDAVADSRIAIDSVRWLKIASGAFEIRTRFAGETVDLLSPVVVPLLGGEVRLDRLALSGALPGGTAPDWSASASLSKVSLDELSRELDWPPFSGAISGMFEDMRYANNTLTVGGGVLVNAFDGNIRIAGLSIQEPLGAVPVLSADATIRGLDLEALTRTFSFGRIQGRLDGDLEGLKMVAWQPAGFDLHLYTPEKDRSRRRISQRAVENLTELGSGLPAGLTGSFLSVFDEFSYDAIDIQIDLRGRVATVDGLARKDGGYYLVRGSGLPRIDVIGRNRSVDWNDLVARLRDIRLEGINIQ
jgi:hypothetical protein